MGSARPLACIDVGSNTTRLLVAAPAPGGGLREVETRRAFTCVGRSLTDAGAVPPAKLEEVAGVVAEQAGIARALGADRIAAVATAAIRRAANAAELVAAVARESGVELRVLSGEDEARLAFLGATRTLRDPIEGTLAVLDVGGGSTEVAIGRAGGEVEWSCSLPIGSGLLTDAHVRSDPPAAEEIDAARRHAREVLAAVRPPAVAGALAVGGSATSLRRVAGRALDHDALAAALGLLVAAPAAELAERFSLAPERARLLPAGVVVLGELARLVGRPIRVCGGGLREGVLLELLGGGA